MTKIYFLYNDYRLSVLFDINSKIRIESLTNQKNITLIKLSNIGNIEASSINKKNILIIEESSIPSSTHNFNFNNMKIYDYFISLFNHKVLFFEDLHYYTFKTYANLHNDLQKYNIKNCISFYDCLEYNYITKILHSWHGVDILSHNFDSKIFKDYNLPKTIDILLYGDIQKDHYPFRNRLNKLLNSELFYNYKIKIIPRNSYFINKYQSINDIVNHRIKLAKLINSSHLCIATCSRYDYFLCKYLEIAGCKSVVLGNIENIGRKIFENNFIEINNNMSDKEIFKIIENALADKHKLVNINNIMYDKVHNNYTIKNHYYINLLKTINSIITQINNKNKLKIIN